VGRGLVVVSPALDARTPEPVKLRVTGGAGARIPSGWALYASWPLAVLILDDEGLALSLRGPWILRLLRLFWFPVRSWFEWDSTKWWSAPWREIVKVEASWRGLVVYRQDGSTCKFVSIRHRTIISVIDFVQSRGCTIVKVPTTILKPVR
jgi:hypothetical protein